MASRSQSSFMDRVTFRPCFARGHCSSTFGALDRLFVCQADCPTQTNATLERNGQLSRYGWCLHTGEVFVDGQWRQASDVLGGPLRGIVTYHLAHLIPYRRAGRRADGSTYAAGDLRGDSCYRITKTSAQLEQGASAIARIIAAIRAGGFYWNPSAMYGGCDACPVKHACGNGLASNRALAPDQLEAA